ncbi:MFS transporter [Breoghania sp.]|uniref:MFS transporter n=1 Tax=Breoghania sp. TaxID=2065378 RepID=UPI0026333FD7|nr:MFS transporter [Breoghania sp.]MDJ0932864.1 MFS transporter [Breoghania sp.]
MFREKEAAVITAEKDDVAVEEIRSEQEVSSDSVTQLHVIAVLSALMAFASISTDFYLPAMTSALGASEGMISYTISGYLIGFSFGQLVWGPVSDHYGRRVPIAGGLVLFVIGSAGCAVSQSTEAVIVCRIVQALGASASVVLSRATVSF